MIELLWFALALVSTFVCGYQVGKLVELDKHIKELEELWEAHDEIARCLRDLDDILFGGDDDDETN